MLRKFKIIGDKIYWKGEWVATLREDHSIATILDNFKSSIRHWNDKDEE